MLSFTVDQSYDGATVKTFLRKKCGVSARTLAKLKRTPEGITVDGKTVRSIDILHSGDVVCIDLPEDRMHIEPVDIPVEIVYEYSNVVVFNKPPGMPVHPVHEYRLNTLANAAAFHCIRTGENYTFRPVNRLDKDTSGLVLTAKNAYAAAVLPGNTKKRYMALCEGRIEGSAVIDAPLRICEGHGIQRETGEGGVRAVTHLEAVKNYGDEYTLLDIWLETGRTHQIRAHLASISHPLAGDDMYGGSRKSFPRQCLHCSEMEFISPGDNKVIRLKRTIDFFDEIRNTDQS